MLVELLIIIFSCVAWFTFLNRRPKKSPPGPFSWPFVGNVFQIGDEPYKTLMKMRAKYGDIISLSFGHKHAVILNDVKIIKEALNMNSLSGRLNVRHTHHPDSKKPRGVIMTEGAEWVEQRRFMLKNLRDFGFGKKSMEVLVQEEVTELIEGFQKLNGEPIATLVAFNVAVVNALWSITAGERFKHDDAKFNKLIHYITEYLSINYVAIVFFPWVIDLAPNWSGYNAVMGRLTPIYKFIQESIDSHKKTYQEGIKRDMIDCYLDAIRSASGSSTFVGKSGDEHMLFGLFDLFLAGSETTSTTLTWVCYLLAHFPKSQEKLNQVITDKIGTTRLPCLADRPNVPFVEAAIMEVMRYSAMIPMGVAHTATEDTEFHGYIIRKGTMIMPNQFGVMHDPAIWGDPENFRPERFMSEDGQSVVRHEALIPFSTGKRVCLGESLARDELFLFTTSILQRFQVQFDPHSPKPELGHSVQTSVLMPKQHKIVFRDRY